MTEINGLRLFRVFVPVTDLLSAVEFYQQLFESEGTPIRGGRHYFYCGDCIVAVVENSGAAISDHLYFAVKDLERTYTCAAALDCLEDAQMHNMPAEEIQVRPWGERSFYARDPFGNGLCFVDESTLYTGTR